MPATEAFKALIKLQEREEEGGIIVLKSLRRASIIVAPTCLIDNASEMDAYLDSLLSGTQKIYRVASVDSPLDQMGGLFYPRADYLYQGGLISIQLYPDDQLAESMYAWEKEARVVSPSTSKLAGLTKGLEKNQLTALRKDPFGFNEGLKRYIAGLSKRQIDNSYLPIGGVRPRNIIPGVKGLI